MFQTSEVLEDKNQGVKAEITASSKALGSESSVEAFMANPINIASNPLYVPTQDWIIPKESSFFMHYSPRTQAVELNNFAVVPEGTMEREHLVLNAESGSVLVTNVGMWEGKVVNVRISVSDYKMSSPNSSRDMIIQLTKTSKFNVPHFLSVKTSAATAKITYSFENQAGKPINLGMYMALQMQYGSQIGIETNRIRKLTAWNYSPAPYYYTESDGVTMLNRNNASGSQPGFIGLESVNISQFSISLIATTQSPQYQFYSDVPVKIETPDLDAINQTLENVDLEESVSVNYGQAIPFTSTPDMDSYSWNTVIPDDPYYEFENITVTNWLNEDKTNFFDVTKDGDKVTISGNQLDKLEFYDDYYTFSVNYKLKNGMVIPKDQLDENGYYSLSMIANSNLTSTSLIKLDYVYISDVSVSPNTANILLNKTQQLTATVFPEEATDKSVTWSSSDSNIATVDINGLVTAVNPGVAIMTATTKDGSKATSEITVIQPVTGIELTPGKADILVDKELSLSEKVVPDNAVDKSVTWSSSNEEIAVVSDSGIVTGKGPGVASITVTTNDGGFTATSEITVIQPVTGIEMLPKSVDLFLGKTATAMLSTIVSPENASNKSVTWSSSDTSIAMVANGVVIGLKPGKVTITATTTDGGHTATSEVTVIQPVTGIEVSPESAELIVGGSTTSLIATVFPESATDKSVIWSSSDESIVSVLGVSTVGMLTAKSPGTATITVTTKDGSFIATSEIKVVAPYNLLQKVMKLDGNDADEAHLGEELIYETTVDSLLPSSSLLYKDFTLTASIDESLEDVTQIELKTSEGKAIGSADYNPMTKKVTGKVVEADQIREGENIVLSYHSKVKQDVSFGTEILGKMGAVKSYVDGTVLSEEESNEVRTIVTAGELIFESAPAGLNFGKPVKLSSQEKEYPLETQDGQLSIKDLRGNGNQWSLTAKMTQLLTHSSGKELPEAMYYRKSGIEQLISLDSAALIYDGTTSSANQVVLSDKWLDPTSQSQPFIKVKGGQALKGEYQGVIQWTLQDVPNGNFDSKSEIP